MRSRFVTSKYITLAALLLVPTSARSQTACEAPCDPVTLNSLIVKVANSEWGGNNAIYVEDGACDGTVVAVPPDYRPTPETLAILECAQCAAPVLISHLDDARPTTARFKGGEFWSEPIRAPLGYVCLDLLRAITAEGSSAFDPSSVDDDSLGAGIRPSFYFRPDVFQQRGSTDETPPQVRSAKQAWESALSAGTLEFQFHPW